MDNILHLARSVWLPVSKKLSYEEAEALESHVLDAIRKGIDHGRRAAEAKLRTAVPEEPTLVEVDCTCRHPGSLGGDCDGSCAQTGTPGRVLQYAHSDDVAVDRFAVAMKAKLAKKRAEGYGGWDDPTQCSIEFIAKLLREHVDKGDPVDIGNFAMMLFNRAISEVKQC